MESDEPPVADRIEDYAEIAVKLGRDPARREALRAELKAAAHKKLFNDVEFVREFEAFCQEALHALPAVNTRPV